jgi:hypothetical protein
LLFTAMLLYRLTAFKRFDLLQLGRPGIGCVASCYKFDKQCFL